MQNPFGDLRTIRPDEDRKFALSNGSLIAVSYEARAKGVKRWAMLAQRRASSCNQTLKTILVSLEPIGGMAQHSAA